MLLDSAHPGRSLDALWPDTTAPDVLDDPAFETPRVASRFCSSPMGTGSDTCTWRRNGFAPLYFGRRARRPGSMSFGIRAGDP